MVGPEVGSPGPEEVRPPAVWPQAGGPWAAAVAQAGARVLLTV